MTPPPPAFFLKLGALDVPVRYGGGGRQEPARSGELVTTWYNNAFTSEVAAETKQQWQFTTPPVPSAEWLVLQALLESGTFVLASGYAISRAMVPVDPLDPTGPQQPDAVLVAMEMNGVVHHMADDNTDIAYEITFTLSEV